MSLVEVRVPGDKSVAHRLLILASLAEGRSRIRELPSSLDVDCTRRCLRDLGAHIHADPDGVTVEGPTKWTAPAVPLECGNSGTTARLLAGLVAGLGVGAELRGDRSLGERPMDRVLYPLQAMGARVEYLAAPDRLPVRIEERSSGGLRTLRYRPRVSSAQVRGAILLAGLTSGTDVVILDRGRARDHTERLLAFLGGPVHSRQTSDGVQVELSASTWDGRLSAFDVTVPGDLSSAAFLVVAALLAGRSLEVRGVGLNPTRTGVVDVLTAMGARVVSEIEGTAAGEPVGFLRVEPSALRAFEIRAPIVPRLIDEIPALVVLASRVEGVSSVAGAAELRVKESDRLDLLCLNLRSLGVECEERQDGLRVHGTSAPLRGTVRTDGDHRIAMAFGALGRCPGCKLEIDDPSCVEVSFPDFWDAIDRVTPAEEAR